MFVQANSMIPQLAVNVTAPGADVSLVDSYPAPGNASVSAPFDRWRRVPIYCPLEECLALVTVQPDPRLFFGHGEVFVEYSQAPHALLRAHPSLQYFRSPGVRDYDLERADD